MTRIFLLLGLVLSIAACGGTSGRAPSNLEDACEILQERRGYLSAFRATEEKWGVPVHVQMAIIYQESKFISDARTPFRYSLGVIPMGRQSSAFGYSQALDATWREYKQDQGRFGARRDNIRDASDFMGWYLAESHERLGLALDDTRNQYLAYHDGRTGYRRGTWRRKPWLVRIAGEITARAAMYETQLATCPVKR